MGNEDIKVIADRQELVDIADAVREKTGNGKSMGIGEIVRNIRNMSSGTVNNQSKTVSPTEQQQIVTPDAGYDGLSSVTVNAIASDYVGSNVPREDAKTITPTKSSQVAVSGGTYVNGDISIGAIPSEYITTTDADAIAEEIALNKIAYVDGKKVVGSFTIENEVSNQEEIISTQDEMIANIVSALEGKAAGGGASIPTCTVEAPTIGRYFQITFLTFNNGVLEYTYASLGDVIPNVVCGSIYIVSEDMGQFTYWDTLNVNGENLMLHNQSLGFGSIPLDCAGEILTMSIS